MPRVENLKVLDSRLTSYRAVSAVRLTLGNHMDELIEAGLRPYQKNGKLHIRTSVPVSDAKIFSPEWDEAWERKQQEGGVQDLEIRRDIQTGLIAYAEIVGKLPATLTDKEARGLFVADGWHARLQFPPQHDADETQRAVLDTWQVPMTHLTLAANALGIAHTPARKDAYDQLFENICRRTDEAGRSLGAIAIEHTVYGRNSIFEEGELQRLDAVMGSFSDGVQDVIARQNA